jgi:hypothetical protein
MTLNLLHIVGTPPNNDRGPSWPRCGFEKLPVLAQTNHEACLAPVDLTI